VDVFDLRRRVIDDYASYVRSFFAIRDERIRAHVDAELEGGRLWPEPLLQVSPAFEPGDSLDQLIAAGELHPDARSIFVHRSPDGVPQAPLALHRHQVEGLRAARRGASYVLTTGTGSGKSLAYIVPIVDHVLRAPRAPGIKALVVYPMNALANSQLGELKKYLAGSRVTFKRYTGQESQAERAEIIADPPDILLTNYMMLELILTRPHDAPLLRQAAGLRFLVLDELHTYRGRQGADVAMLVRRTREASGAAEVIHVGTSATLSGSASWPEQQREVAALASTIFGTHVAADAVIGESLRRQTPVLEPTATAALSAAVAAPVDDTADRAALLAHPLASWIESTLGVRTDAGRLVRTRPEPLTGPDGAAQRLAAETRQPAELCEAAIRSLLLAGARARAFAFRLHQFVSRGEAVFVSPEPEASRYITLQAQEFVPDSARSRRLLPVAFCRECGQDYYIVRRTRDDDGRVVYRERDVAERIDPEAEGGDEAGFLFISTTHPWPADDPGEVLARVPESWLEVTGRGVLRVKRTRAEALPRSVFLAADGTEGAGDIAAAWFPAPFLYCLHCGVAYDAHQTSDFGKLATLGSEGRSTATTVLAMSTVRALRRDPQVAHDARKLLSFTDNRQDASLQAGHFNDFIEIAQLRSGLWRAIEAAGANGLRHDELAIRVFQALDLPLEQYALNPAVEYLQREETERALREALGYYLYRDLQRGWRITQPNLEQTGLLVIDYLALTTFASDPRWQTAHRALAQATPERRVGIARTLLDYLRRELCVRVSYLDPVEQERIAALSNQHLIPPWAVNTDDRLDRSTTVYARSRSDGAEPDFHQLFLSPRGGFGLYLKRRDVLGSDGALTTDDVAAIIADLLRLLVIPGILVVTDPPRTANAAPGYQIAAAALVWRAGTGAAAFHDPIRVPAAPDDGLRANRFFQGFYRGDAVELRRLHAREHTAQVPSKQREQREDQFRAGALPVMFCSPTMELGVDISTLNVVNLRNVPPTPANYAQRSGRAGRSGQPAFILAYCSTGSPHDQYFFRRPRDMVAGAVIPPRIDLENEDLLRAHIHAMWLMVAGAHLGTSLRDVLDVAGDRPTLAVMPDLASKLHDPVYRASTHARARAALGPAIEAMVGPAGSVDTWLATVLRELPLRFEAACQRWRSLYQATVAQLEHQNRRLRDASLDVRDREAARRLHADAQAQLTLLLDATDDQHADFYSYRYFASEGFLPGYNFPRLPLSAFLPGRRRRRGETDDFLSRPRFLAISEFGPRAIVYHEGARFQVNKVILPVGGDEPALDRRAAVCPACGYLHPLLADPAPDCCDGCGQPGLDVREDYFHMQNVATRRRDRINSDEEERFRIGYELRTTYRFATREGVPSQTHAVQCDAEGTPVAIARYGHAATLWRINLGWRRRADPDRIGYMLDVERGYWEKEPEEDSPPDPVSRRVQRVVPYVTDTRNCLVIRSEAPLDVEVMASLEAALKVAIQVEFQLEDRELGAEPLPTRDDRRQLLLYEASEGGAGVLRRLVEEPDALARVARRALAICHFDPETGDDLGHAPGARERCEAACYDCLRSYYNQRDHVLLDRQAIAPLLRRWAGGRAQMSPRARSRHDHHEALARQCQSDLERRWLALVHDRGHRLPDDAQAFLDDLRVRPDFLYRHDAVAVFVDGPHHDQPGQRAEDATIDARLADAGWSVIRFHHAAAWEPRLDAYPRLFGAATVAPGPPPSPAAPATVAPTRLDLDLFEPGWHAAMQALADAGLTITGGEEVMQGGRVIDQYLATVTRGAVSLRLVDLDAATGARVARALESQGERVVRVRVAMPDLVARVLAALEPA
jgi:very-short-patch-repair endonuclease